MSYYCGQCKSMVVSCIHQIGSDYLRVGGDVQPLPQFKIHERCESRIAELEAEIEDLKVIVENKPGTFVYEKNKTRKAEEERDQARAQCENLAEVLEEVYVRLDAYHHPLNLAKAALEAYEAYKVAKV